MRTKWNSHKYPMGNTNSRLTYTIFVNFELILVDRFISNNWREKNKNKSILFFRYSFLICINLCFISLLFIFLCDDDENRFSFPNHRHFFLYSLDIWTRPWNWDCTIYSCYRWGTLFNSWIKIISKELKIIYKKIPSKFIRCSECRDSFFVWKSSFIFVWFLSMFFFQ